MHFALHAKFKANSSTRMYTYEKNDDGKKECVVIVFFFFFRLSDHGETQEFSFLPFWDQLRSFCFQSNRIESRIFISLFVLFDSHKCWRRLNEMFAPMLQIDFWLWHAMYLVDAIVKCWKYETKWMSMPSQVFRWMIWTITEQRNELVSWHAKIRPVRILFSSSTDFFS